MYIVVPLFAVRSIRNRRMMAMDDFSRLEAALGWCTTKPSLHFRRFKRFRGVFMNPG
jgi:hypothetical protein